MTCLGDILADVVERDELMARAVELTKLLQSMGTIARERQAVFAALYDEHGMTDQAIANVVGMTRQGVEAIRKGRGISKP